MQCAQLLGLLPQHAWWRSFLLLCRRSAAASHDVPLPCIESHHSLPQICAVRRGLESLLHSHGFALEDCLITVGWPPASFEPMLLLSYVATAASE